MCPGSAFEGSNEGCLLLSQTKQSCQPFCSWLTQVFSNSDGQNIVSTASIQATTSTPILEGLESGYVIEPLPPAGQAEASQGNLVAVPTKARFESHRRAHFAPLGDGEVSLGKQLTGALGDRSRLSMFTAAPSWLERLGLGPAIPTTRHLTST